VSRRRDAVHGVPETGEHAGLPHCARELPVEWDRRSMRVARASSPPFRVRGVRCECRATRQDLQISSIAPPPHSAPRIAAHASGWISQHRQRQMRCLIFERYGDCKRDSRMAHVCSRCGRVTNGKWTLNVPETAGGNPLRNVFAGYAGGQFGIPL